MFCSSNPVPVSSSIQCCCSKLHVHLAGMGSLSWGLLLQGLTSVSTDSSAGRFLDRRHLSLGDTGRVRVVLGLTVQKSPAIAVSSKCFFVFCLVPKRQWRRQERTQEKSFNILQLKEKNGFQVGLGHRHTCKYTHTHTHTTKTSYHCRFSRLSQVPPPEESH